MKKLLKVIAIVLGAIAMIVLVPLSYLSYKGIVTVNWTVLYGLVSEAAIWCEGQLVGLISAVDIAVPAFAGFGAGFLLGFHVG